MIIDKIKLNLNKTHVTLGCERINLIYKLWNLNILTIKSKLKENYLF